VRPWVAILVVLGALGLLLGAAVVVRRRFGLSAEGSRKLVHVGMGVVTLAFPWLFERPAPVFLLCGAGATLLVLVRFWPPLRNRLGGALGDVERASFGEFYFPVAVATLFAMTHHQPIRYVVPILLLGFADAVAALVGRRYGLTHYETQEGHKTWEGSLAFFTVAFFVIHVPLLLFTDTGRVQTLLIAVTLGLVSTLFEAIAWRGLDNLLVPLMGYAILSTYLRLSTGELLARLGVTIALVAFVWAWRRRTDLNGAALFASALGGYACFAVGGWHWMLPPLVLFVAYTAFTPETQKHNPRTQDVRAVLGIMGPGLLWLMLYHEVERPEWYLPFVASYAAQLSFSGIAQLAYRFPSMSGGRLVTRCAVFSWALLMVPYATWMRLMGGDLRLFFMDAAMVALGVGLSSVAFWWLQPDIRDLPRTSGRWLRQGLFATGASLFVLLRFLV